VGRLRGYGNGIVAPQAQAFIEVVMDICQNCQKEITEPGEVIDLRGGVRRTFHQNCFTNSMENTSTTQTEEHTTPITKIISGGQTGADRAGLDFAIANNIPHGGHCPKNRKSLDGKIDEKYQLEETVSGGYSDRTKLNVENSDATVIFTLDSELEGGSLKTLQHAAKMKKPCLHVHMAMIPAEAAALVGLFLVANSISVVNIAGQRAQKAAGIEGFVQKILTAAKVCLDQHAPAPVEVVEEAPTEPEPATRDMGPWVTDRWATQEDLAEGDTQIYVFRDGGYSPVTLAEAYAAPFEAWCVQLPF
jgi:hypothetical protein